MAEVLAFMNKFMSGACLGRFKKEENFTILLLGQSGSGKTSFLNLMANFDKFVAADVSAIRKDGLRLYNAMSIENDAGPMCSKTSDAHIYRLQVAEEVWVNIIDTPGFGDSRGFEEDKKHVKKIMNALNSHHQIHCVMLVINGRESRLNGTLRYVLAQLTSIMPKTVLDNVQVLFTNTKSASERNFEPSILQTEFGINILSEHCGHIDNPFCIVKKLIDCCAGEDSNGPDIDDEDPLEDAVKGGKTALRSLSRMFEKMKELQPVPTYVFLELMAKKEEFERTITNFHERLQVLTVLNGKVQKQKDRVRDGHQPEETTIETMSWELVPCDDQRRICNVEGCHCDCMTNDAWQGHENRETAGTSLLGVGAASIAGGVIWGTAAMALTLSTGGWGAIAVAATPSLGTVFVGGGTAVVASSWLVPDKDCPRCGHSCRSHGVRKRRWQQKVERRQIITEEAQRQAAASSSQQQAILSQLERSADELEAEQKAVQKEMSRAFADYGSVCIDSGLRKTLLQQLQGIRERMEGAVDETERENLQAHQHEIQRSLEAVEVAQNYECPICLERPRDDHFHCGHSACRLCTAELWEQDEPRCPECRAELSMARNE